MSQAPQKQQRRSLYIKQHQAFDILQKGHIKTQEKAVSSKHINLAVGIDRTSLSPCITVSSANSSEESFLRIPFNYHRIIFEKASPIVSQIISFLGLPLENHEPLQEYIRKLWPIFMEKEAFLMSTRASITDNVVVVHEARFGFDDAAFRSAGRQKEVHALRDIRDEVPEEVKAERQGAIYVKYGFIPGCYIWYD
jgi:succinyl-CoA synthetase alpha subunit